MPNRLVLYDKFSLILDKDNENLYLSIFLNRFSRSNKPDDKLTISHTNQQLFLLHDKKVLTYRLQNEAQKEDF